MKFVNFTTKSNRVFLATFDHIFVFRARIENSGPSFHVFKVYKQNSGFTLAKSHIIYSAAYTKMTIVWLKLNYSKSQQGI